MAMSEAPYLQPAEWAPQRACWTAYPCDAALWGDGLAAAQAEVLAMVRAIAPSTQVVLAAPAAAVPELRARLAGLACDVVAMRYGDIWLRDTAPIFVHDATGAVVAARFRFNGWGGKYVLPHDDAVAAAVQAAAAVPATTADMVLEGGAIDGDGDGTLLTSRQCLRNPNRNGQMPLRRVQDILHAALGCSRLIWLDRGLHNDHTDGHVDTLARFVAPATVACMVPAERDPNGDALAAVRATLESERDARGRPLRVCEIPSPGRVADAAGRLLPASYLNFYIANAAVVVPTYGVAADAAAVAAVAALFPERRTVGCSARAILAGGGALHCITQQQPMPRLKAAAAPAPLDRSL